MVDMQLETEHESSDSWERFRSSPSNEVASGWRSSVRLLYWGPDDVQFAALLRMLGEVIQPKFAVDHAQDERLAREAVAHTAYDAVFVELGAVGRAWKWFARDVQDADVPVVIIDVEGTPATRTTRRARFIQQGASGYVLRPEISGALLESSVFSAVDHVQTKRALRDVQERFALAVRGANDGVWEWWLESDEMYFSQRWRELLGYGVDDLSNSAEEWFARVHPDDLAGLKADIKAHLAGEKAYHEREHRLRASDGTYRWVISRAVAQRESGRPLRMAGSLTDTSDFRLRAERMREESRHDPLTGLLRREPFLEQLGRAVAATKQPGGYAFTVLMVDVDRFRWLADSIGHQAADGMLTSLAQRLLANVRPGDSVSRFGGDKFTILLEGMGDLRIASEIASRIRVGVHEPFEVGGQTVYATVSIGLTTSERGYKDADEVVADVAAAANKAKELGQDRHEVFDAKMRVDALSTLRLEVALRQAVDRGEFELHYQPIVELNSRRLVGFEALTRWRHPRREVVPPAEFIPVAEQTGLIVPIGRWAIRTAIRELARWYALFPDQVGFSISVNLSGRQIADPRLFEEIEGGLQEQRIPAGAFRLELTESTLMKNADSVRRVLAGLRKRGVEIWIDDFGTGYSSLSYLHRFPFDGLKIDKAFIDALDGLGEGTAMVRTILSMAHDLGVKVIAEGIETTTQAERLIELGCGRGQGFLFGRPLPNPSIPSLVTADD